MTYTPGTGAGGDPSLTLMTRRGQDKTLPVGKVSCVRLVEKGEIRPQIIPVMDLC